MPRFILHESTNTCVSLSQCCAPSQAYSLSVCCCVYLAFAWRGNEFNVFLNMCFSFVINYNPFFLLSIPLVVHGLFRSFSRSRGFLKSLFLKLIDTLFHSSSFCVHIKTTPQSISHSLLVFFILLRSWPVIRHSLICTQ